MSMTAYEQVLLAAVAVSIVVINRARAHLQFLLGKCAKIPVEDVT